MAAAIRSKEIFIRSNGWGYPFEKNLHPFKRLRLSVRWKLSFVQTAEVVCANKIFIRLKKNGHPFEKKIQFFEWLILSVWKELRWFEQLMSPVGKNSIQLFARLLLFDHTKLISCSIGQQFLMGFRLSNGWDYLFRRNFIQPPEWLCSFKTNIQPFWFKRPCLSILKEKLYLKSQFKK